MRTVNIWSLTLLLFAQTEVYGAESYRLEVISQTGELTALGNPITRLGTGPSINDAGRVAYTVEIEDGRQGIFVSGDSRARSVLIENLPVYPGTAFHRVSSNFYFGDTVQINNRNQIALRIKSHDGIFSVIVRLGIEVDDTRIVAKTYWDNSALFGSDLLSPFLGPFPYWWEGLSSQVTLSNTGRVVFSAIPRLAPLTKFIVTPQSTEAINHDFLSSYHFSDLLGVFLDGGVLAPTLFPFVSDNDRIVLRGGHSKTAPIMVFSDSTLRQDTAFAVATDADFEVLGAAPGISDDGKTVAFVGIHKGQGGGIFVSVLFEYGFSEPIKVAGAADGLVGIAPEPRVGINRSGKGSTGDYELAYIAFGPERKMGLYTSNIDISEPLAPKPGDTRLIVEVGDKIKELPGTVNDIKVYDPVNNKGQLAFWVSTTTGAQAIVRTALPVLESFDANRAFSSIGFPLERAPQHNLAALADFEPVDFTDFEDRQVHAIAADGVSLLLLRLTIPGELEGEVTFTLDNSAERPSGPLGTIWLVDDVNLVSHVGDKGDWDSEAPVGDTSLSVDAISHEGNTYAFALYRSPRNFDVDTLDDIFGPLPRTRIRGVIIRAKFAPLSSPDQAHVELQNDIYIVRPPVLLVHGTWDSPRGWDNFLLWSESASETNGFSPVDAGISGFPFVTFRLDYEANNAGRLETNAKLILPQIEEAISRFRTCVAFRDVDIHRVAATQADIVTHSYGGPIVRKASQLQLYPYPNRIGDDPPPIVTDGRAFRTIYNWGYGYIHKLITMSGTHKGSQMTAHTARVNALSGGQINKIAIKRDRKGWPLPLWFLVSHNRIDGGAMADQHVVSEALKSLVETIYPSHAVVGSGLIEHGVAGNVSTLFAPLEMGPFDLLWWSMMGSPFDLSQEAEDLRNGPYGLQAGSVRPFEDLTTARRLVNFVFNLDHEEGAQLRIIDPAPWSKGGSGDAPNYDLTARLSSMLGGMEGDAVTDVRHLDPYGSVSNAFVGQLTHLAEISDNEVAKKLAVKIAFLLRQPTASKYFAHFPAVAETIDEFDELMMEEFPQSQVEKDLLVYPADLEVDPYFEDEASQRLENGENGLDIINPWLVTAGSHQ